MKNYLRLVHMEVHRFRYNLLALMLLTAIIQFVTLLITTLNQVAQRLSPDWLASDTNFNSYGYNLQGDRISFAAIMNYADQPYSISILLCITALLIYVGWIWYRDWFGQRTFIYRLLMLPSARMQLYWAKLTAILLFVFSLVSFQWILLLLQNQLFKVIVPAELYADSRYSDVIWANEILRMLLPSNFDEFMIKYGAGAIGVIMIFTAILIERSSGRLGILFGLGYAALSGGVLFSAMVIYIDHSISFLYPNEILAIGIVLLGLIGVGSVWLSSRLLTKKISV